VLGVFKRCIGGELRVIYGMAASTILGLDLDCDLDSGSSDGAPFTFFLEMEVLSEKMIQDGQD
jgi:hypothetical protein